jgi:Secretion system C-terminal sorting domain
MRYILIFISALFFNNSNAQAPAQGFAKTYTLNALGSTFPHLLTKNDTIITLGNMPVPNPPYYPWKISVNKIDTLGRLLSTNMVNDTTNNDYYVIYSSDFINTSDNGYIAVGCINNGLYGNIVKFNHDGGTEWIKKTRTTLNSQFNGFFDVAEYDINKYVVMGIQNPNSFQNSLWVYFVDRYGTKVRDTTYFRTGAVFQSPNSITVLSPNKIILGAGWGDYQTPWLLEIDSLGRIQREWRAPTNLGLEQAYGLQPTPDGGLIFCGARFDSIRSPDNTVHMTKGAITKLNSNLQLEWTKIVGESTADNKFVNGIITQDGNYVAIGQYVDFYNADHSQGAQSAWTQKVDMQGNGIWSSKDTALYIPSRNATLDYAWDIKELSSGSLIICGDATDLAAQPNRSTAFLIKLSNDGCRDTLFCHGRITPTASYSPSRGGESVSISPNPTTGTLHLTHTEGTALKSYTIADISGRIIAQNTSIPNDNELNLDLPNGVYFLIINDINGQTSRHKVVVLK